MENIKSFLKLFIPPIISSRLSYHSNKNLVSDNVDAVWSGDYSSWAEAEKKCTGYNSSIILEKCKASLLLVKNGEAIYERDSVLFDKVQYSWGLLSGLQKAALENKGKLCVLDFGGSLGTTYFQNKNFLQTIKELIWCVVEQPHFVSCGKEYFEDLQLKFFNSIDECLSFFTPNVILLSGVLAYLEKPYEWIEKFLGLRVEYIILDRTAFVDYGDDLLTIQKVPNKIYSASYPSWFFNESRFLSKFKGYMSLGSFESFCDEPLLLNSSTRATWRGHILKKE